MPVIFGRGKVNQKKIEDNCVIYTTSHADNGSHSNPNKGHTCVSCKQSASIAAVHSLSLFFPPFHYILYAAFFFLHA